MTQQEQIQALMKQNEELMNQLKTQQNAEQSKRYSNSTNNNYNQSGIGELFFDAVTFGAGFSLGDNIIDNIFS